MPNHQHKLNYPYAVLAGAKARNNYNTNLSPQVKVGETGLASGDDGCFFTDRLIESYSLTSYTGNSKAHNNLPPYLAICIWKRTN